MRKGRTSRILLTHTPEMFRNYYGERALARLRELGEVRLHGDEHPAEGGRLVAAARGWDIGVSGLRTPGDALVFEKSPQLVAFLRCAVDIRTIDVAAASRAGVLVTRASPGFVPAVSELVLGLLVDLSRGISRSAADYHAGRVPRPEPGRQLSGSTLGVIGYGAIGRRLAALGAVLGMRVLVSDSHVGVPAGEGIEQMDLPEVLAAADYVVCLATATPETENLMNDAAFAGMKRGAFFINVSRGNLVDEVAARDVDEESAALHARERRVVHQVLGLGGRGREAHDVIRRRQHLGQVHLLDPLARGHAHVGVGHEHP